MHSQLSLLTETNRNQAQMWTMKATLHLPTSSMPERLPYHTLQANKKLEVAHYWMKNAFNMTVYPTVTDNLTLTLLVFFLHQPPYCHQLPTQANPAKGPIVMVSLQLVVKPS